MLIKAREFSDIRIYSDPKGIKRIGSPKELLKEYTGHMGLAKLGFPVPKIIVPLDVGNIQAFYIEENVGIFTIKDTILLKSGTQKGKVNDESFNLFFKSIKNIASLQLKNKFLPKDAWERNIFSRFYELEKEKPELGNYIQDALRILQKDLSDLAMCYSHGDLHPGNMVETKVIDFEHYGIMPLGYDLVTSVFSESIFAHGSAAKSYQFQTDQIDKFFYELDNLFLEEGVSRLTCFIRHFLVMRLVWSSVRLSKWKETQTYRHELCSKFLYHFINGFSMKDLITIGLHDKTYY